MKRLLLILMIPFCVAIGVGAGLMTKDDGQGQVEGKSSKSGPDDQVPRDGNRSFVKIGKQTIVPVVDGGETRALMLFELAMDVPAGDTARVNDLEPRLRAAFLRELFRMSYTGAFMTNFTDDRVIDELRRNLTRAARAEVGHRDAEVLILDVMRQEL